MAGKTRYYINMNDGRVIAGTDETKDNVFYREIDVTWAFAIRDGKVTAKDVIDKVNAKVGMIPFSEMMKSVQKLNVRTRDLHLEDHAQGEDASSAQEVEEEGVLGEFKEAAKPAARKAKAATDAIDSALSLPAKEADGAKDKPAAGHGVNV